MRSLIVVCVIGVLMLGHARAQLTGIGVPVPIQRAEGSQIQSVLLEITDGGTVRLADSVEQQRFTTAFGIRTGSVFRQAIVDEAIKVILAQAIVSSAYYDVYSTEVQGPLIIVVHITLLQPGQMKEIDGKKGIAVSGQVRDFPVIVETDHSKLMFIFNGGTGIFNEVNGFFSQGPAFTAGNPVATDPAQAGVRFWGEAYVEPGISGIIKLGDLPIYAYGAVSVLVSGRNSSDVYSYGPTIFSDIERAYVGVVAAKLGPDQDINIDLSVGRQFFELNNGLLIAKFSGSANAGERGSVYLNSRTAFERSIIAKVHKGNWVISGFMLEPQELFPDRQTDTRYVGGTLGFNDNSHLDVNVTYLTINDGTGTYSTPTGRIGKDGLYAINPKVWLKEVFGTGLFLRGEYVYQAHRTQDMIASGWYASAGYRMSNWSMQPTLTYRYAWMSGDDPSTPTYERFDAMLTGGLGNWVQGINARKVMGNGNFVTHRIELKANLNASCEISVDYFLLQASSLSNNGSLAPITTLNSKEYGYEITGTMRYFLSNHFMLLGILSYNDPGSAITQAFSSSVLPWTSYQCAVFMFF